MNENAVKDDFDGLIKLLNQSNERLELEQEFNRLRMSALSLMLAANTDKLHAVAEQLKAVHEQLLLLKTEE